MDTTLNLAPKAVVAVPYTGEREPPRDTKVQAAKQMDGTATLPADTPFVAQVVNARLSGGDYPETQGEIAPADRTLRPYDTPMLPYEGDAPVAEADNQTQSAATQPN